MISARETFGLIASYFGHGERYDLTNNILAPARMLLKSQKDINRAEYDTWRQHAKETYQRFEENVLKRLAREPAQYGIYAYELQSTCNSLQAWLYGEDRARSAPCILALEGLMDLLTEVRVLAGKRTARLGYPVADRAPAPIGGKDTTYKVLVVDDSAAAWLPVFELVQKHVEGMLGNQDKVSFEFSVDGKHVCEVPIGERLAEYDLILMDVFIGAINGVELLDTVRRFFRYIPVVLWTSSRDIDLPAQAKLANGFLLKKTLLCEEIGNTITSWLQEGRAQRACLIPARFFDQNIRDYDKRVIMQRFSRWCLRHLDGFHALNDSYFLFFTDHGGRHITVVLELIERLIRPMLVSGNLFSSDLAKREEEICVLYLAVLCHEIGMFPIEEEIGEFPRKESYAHMDCVRKLHSVRGMMLFVKPELAAHEMELKVLLHDLRKLESSAFMVSSLPLLVGYHSRLLGRLDKESFGILKNESAIKVIEKCGGSAISPLEVGNVLRCLHSSLAKDKERCERVRRLCALLRFADAIDIDRTRIPASFIILRANKLGEDEIAVRGVANNREYVKRQVVREVVVENGRVIIVMDCPSPKEHMSKVQSILGLSEDKLKDIVANPWLVCSAVEWAQIRNVIDSWLDSFWTFAMQWALLPGKGKDQMSKMIEDLIIKEKGCISEDALQIVATLASLSVMAEIRDEYQAIEDCDLQSYITLDNPVWSKSVGFSREISILEEGLTQYGWKIMWNDDKGGAD
jgi:CheY-like chemotaxis protein